MNVLVLDRADSWHVKDLVRAADSAYGIATTTYDKLGASFSDATGLDAMETTEFHADGASSSNYDAILTRAMPGSSLEQIVFRMDWLNQIAFQQKTVVANPAKSIEACVDKYLSLEKMRSYNLPVPQTHVCQNAADAVRYFVDSGSDCVIKPIFGSRGRGIIRVNRYEEACRLFEELESNGNVIYQQRFVEHGESDLRLLVVGENVFAMSRHRPGHWVTNACLGAKCQKHAATSTECELAISAAQSQGAFIAGVDIVYEGSNPFIVEVNACPSWKTISSVTNMDVGSEILCLLANLCG